MLRKRKEAEDARLATSLSTGVNKKTLPWLSSANKKPKASPKGYTAAPSYDEAEAWEKSRRALEAKAAEYERLTRGDASMDTSLVDFDRKGWSEQEQRYVGIVDPLEGRSQGPLDFLTTLYHIPLASDSSNLIEYVDEFGRSRKITQEQYHQIMEERQETLRLLSKHKEDHQNEETEAEENPIIHHYDSNWEIRTKGVGFFSFAKDEEERQRQMKALKSLRNTTLELRTRSLLRKEQRRLKIASRIARAQAIREAHQHHQHQQQLQQDQDNM